MKKLQSNFTTTEQSKRLLELGVPEWTADCFRWDFSSAFGVSEDNRYSTSISVLCDEYQRDFYDKLPCWSVGRLIEIILLCPLRRNVTISKGYNPIESLINQLVMLREVGTDFSKLEE